MSDPVLTPASEQDWSAQAKLLREQARWPEALSASFAAARADPENPAVLHDLAVLLTKMGRLEEGEAILRHALGRAPNAAVLAHSLSHNLLAQGRYAEAWPFHAARAHIAELNNGYPKNFPFPRWQGEDLGGKRIVVFPEQGFGDQIQLARFLPQLMAKGGRITLLSRQPLVALFQHSFPDVDIVTAEGTTEFPDPDYWTTMYDLPAIFTAGPGDVPSAPYLQSPNALSRPDGGFRIGVCSIGNPRHINDAFRSLPDAVGRRLRVELPGTVVDLDPAVSGARDFAETAAIIASLDLVVSVDTAVAHLAGALGTPCLLLISGFSPDWRWMVGRDDSPWYPHHRLYRSEMGGSWDGAVERVIADARAIADVAVDDVLPALP